MVTRVIDVALGLWLCASAFVWPHGLPQFLNASVIGAMIAIDAGADDVDAPAALGAPRKSLHESEQGFLSFVTCIAVLFFTVLVALVLNSGSAVKQKVELQNSADAAILTSTSLTARGMNAITLSCRFAAFACRWSSSAEASRRKHTSATSENRMM